MKNKNGKPVLMEMVRAIQDNKAYLGELDGKIGDGDHGANMNKGFTLFAQRLGQVQSITLADGLELLGSVVMNEIGGSMGPIYGTIFMEMADVCQGHQEIDLALFSQMMDAGLTGLYDVVEARVGDKTLVDTLYPAAEALHTALGDGADFSSALEAVKRAAAAGRDSTKDLEAKFGRSSRLGKRSIGVLDAGASSCCLLLCAMCDGMAKQL